MSLMAARVRKNPGLLMGKEDRGLSSEPHRTGRHRDARVDSISKVLP